MQTLQTEPICYHFKLQTGLQMPYMLEFIRESGEMFAYSYGQLNSWQLVNKEKLILYYGNERVEIKGFNLENLCPHLSNHTLLWVKEVVGDLEEMAEQRKSEDVQVTSIERLVKEDVFSLDV